MGPPSNKPVPPKLTGFALIQPGDGLLDRYNVIKKLGQPNGLSRTFLVLDTVEQEFRTLQVMRDNVEDYWQESKIISDLGEPYDHPGARFINRLVDTFAHYDANGGGKHICLVFGEPVGLSIYSFMNSLPDTDYIRSEVFNTIVWQTLAAFDSLHQRGVVAVKPPAITIKLPSSVKQLSKQITGKRAKGSINPDLIDEEVAKSSRKHARNQYGVPVFEVCLSGFEQAQYEGEPLKSQLLVDSVYAPELRMGVPKDCAGEDAKPPTVHPVNDIFGLANLFYKLVTNQYLFKSPRTFEFQGEEKANIEWLAEMTGLLGPFPERMKDLMWCHWDVHMDEEKNHFPDVTGYRRLQDAVVEDLSTKHVAVRQVTRRKHHFEHFLQAVLQLHPMDRMGPKQLMHHPFLVCYGGTMVDPGYKIQKFLKLTPKVSSVRAG